MKSVGLHAGLVLLVFYVPLTLAAGSCLYYLAVIFASLKFRFQQEKAADFTPPISILKPVRGIDQGFYESLAGHCRQDYPQFEVIFGLGDAKDPAHWSIAQLRHDFPQIPIKIVVAPESASANRKVNSLQAMLQEAAHEFVVINDADIRVQTDYLRNVIRSLADERVGLVTCLYRGVPGGGLAPIFEALGISGDFAGQVLLATLVEGIQFALGATMVTRKKQIAEIGGLSRWADYLADDYILGNRIAAAGYQIHLSHVVVETLLPRRSFSELFRQQLRWARTIRFARRRGYLGLLLTFGIPFALLAWIIHPHSILAQGVLAVAVIVRLAAAWASGLLVCRDPVIAKFFWLLPLRDLMALGIWVASFLGSQVVWRDQRFQVEAGGKIRPT